MTLVLSASLSSGCASPPQLPIKGLMGSGAESTTFPRALSMTKAQETDSITPPEMPRSELELPGCG